MNLNHHLIRQMAWSHATFGPGELRECVLDHIKKEIVEVEESNGDSSEWVDVILLAIDGLTRSLAFCNGERKDPREVAITACEMITWKQSKNESRTYPDWRTIDRSKAIEHIRGCNSEL